MTMGPIYVTAILTDGDILCLDCARKRGAYCEDHGAWACQHDRDRRTEDFGILNNRDAMDGDEVCGDCLEPFDRRAFDALMAGRDDDRCAICHGADCDC